MSVNSGKTTLNNGGMRAAVLCDVGRIELRHLPRPEPAPHEVLVEIKAVGLCGTDFHIFAGHANYHTDRHGAPIPLTQSPQILGHEMSGIVAAVGAGVTDLAPGDPVVIDQGRNCVSTLREPLCEYCVTGDSHQCEFYQEHGITGLPGGLAEYLAIPARNAVKIEGNLALREAAITEPLGCITHSLDAVNKAQTRYRFNPPAAERHRQIRAVLIIGGGPAGLLFTQYLRNVLGFEGLLIVSEPNEKKRALAAGFGATVIDPLKQNLVEAVQELTHGRRVECLIEGAGAAPVFLQIPGLIRKQATILLYGHGHAGVDLGVMNNIQFREPALIAPVGASGGFDADGRPSTYRRSLELITQRRIDVAAFLTHTYHSLEEVPAAFAGAHRAPDYVKGVVEL